MKLYIGITTSRYFASSTWLLFIALMHLINGVQFLNITDLSLSSVRFAAPSAPSPVTAIVQLRCTLRRRIVYETNFRDYRKFFQIRNIKSL